MKARFLACSFVFTAMLCLAGCQTPARQDNTAILIRHPEFRDAARVAPRFVSDCLLTITNLENQLQSAPRK